MDINAFIKKYYLRFALPIVFLTLTLESAFTNDSFLGKKLAEKVMAGSAQRFWLERGGLREGARGRNYFDSLNFHIYTSEEGKNMALKDFMMEHVTSYEPGIFLGLVNDW